MQFGFCSGALPNTRPRSRRLARAARLRAAAAGAEWRTDVVARPRFCPPLGMWHAAFDGLAEHRLDVVARPPKIDRYLAAFDPDDSVFGPPRYELQFAERGPPERQADAAGIHKEPSLDDPDELNVTVTAEQERLVAVVKQAKQFFVRRGREDHVVVRRGRTVEADDLRFAELKLDPRLERADEGAVAR